MQSNRLAQVLEPRRLMSSGLFAAPVTLDAIPAAETLTVGDFDHNGTPDLAGAGRIDTAQAGSPVTAFIAFNDGAGNFTVRGAAGGFGTPAQVAVADLDGDGLEDIAVLHRDGFAAPTLSVQINFGDGRFVDPPSNFMPTLGLTNSTGITSGDFNGDGVRELMVGNTILFASPGNSPTQTLVPGLLAPRALDMNGDGLDDLLGDASVWINQAGQFIPPANQTSGAAALRWASGDLDHDGDLDLVNGGSGAGEGTPNFFFNRGDNSFAPYSPRLLADPAIPAIGDFNGDGFDDVALALPGANAVFSLLSHGNGTFKPGGSDLATSGGDADAANVDLVAADFNGDGRDDLVTTRAPKIFFAAPTEQVQIVTFGDVGGGRKSPSAVTEAADNRPPALFTLKGPGTGRVFDMGFQTGLRLVLDGTTDATSVTIRTPPRRALTLQGIEVNGSLKSLTATSSGFFGDFSVTGTAKVIKILGGSLGSRLSIAGAGVPTAFTFLNPQDLSLTTQSPISRLSCYQWVDADPYPDVITAPSIGSISVHGGGTSPVVFRADVVVTGGGESIRSIDVRGKIESAVVRAAGSIRSVRATEATDATILAGVAPSVVVPTSAADLVPGVTIGSVRFGTVNGATVVAASSVLRYSAGAVVADPQNRPAGLYATSVGSYSRGGTPPLRRSRLATPEVFDTVGSYVARTL